MNATLASSAVPVLNALLRTLRAAVDTYSKAIRHIERHRDRAAIALRVLHDDHLDMVEQVREEIRRRGGNPDGAPGAWGLWAKSVEGVASLFGDVAAVRALRESEEHGLQIARRALRKVDARAQGFLENAVIPSLDRHLELLTGIVRPI